MVNPRNPLPKNEEKTKKKARIITPSLVVFY
jgi:hypothetical protein